MPYQRVWHRMITKSASGWQRWAPMRTLYDDQLRQLVGGDWDPATRDAFLSQEWERLSTTAGQGAWERRMIDEDELEVSGEPEPAEPVALRQWWMEIAEQDLLSVLPKMQEYGSYDLMAVGSMLAHATQWDDATDAEKTELGCWYYMCGKVARAFDAMRQHRLPSDDTAYDSQVYATMIRRIRQHGSWS